MSRVRARIARASLRLYPAAWRDRYGDELEGLVEEGGYRRGDLADLFKAGIRLRIAAHRSNPGGLLMLIDIAHRHPMAFALWALVLMLPTLAFVTLSVLGHELGVPGLADRVDPVIGAVTATPLFDLALVVAPAVSLLVALAPLLDLGWRGGDGGSVATIAVRIRPVNLLVAAVAAALGAALLAHAITESVLHAAR